MASAVLVEPGRASRLSGRLCLFLLALVGQTFALLLVAADNPWLGQAGGVSVSMAAQELPELLLAWARDVHPPLYYVVLHFWIDVAGTGGYVAKFPSVAAALLALPLAFQLGRRLGGAGLGLLTALLFAVSFLHVVHGMWVRDYALGVTLSLASLYTFVAALAPGARARRWVAYAACSVAALYTYYFALPVLAAQGMYLLLWRRRRLASWLAAIVCVVVASIPWVWLAGPSIWAKLEQGGGVASAEPRPFVLDPESGYLLRALRWLTGADAYGFPPWLVGLMALVVAALAWSLRRRLRTAHSGLLVLGLAATLAFAYGGARVWLEGEAGVARFVYSALPFYAPATALGLRAIGRAHRLALLGTLAVATLFFLRSLQPFFRPGAGPLAGDLVGYLGQHASSRDLVLFTSPLQAGEFASTARDRWTWRLIPTGWEGFTVVFDADQRAAALLEQPRPDGILWLVLWDDDPRNLPVVDTLRERAHLADSAWVGTTYVAGFLWPMESPLPVSGARFAGSVQLAGVAYDEEARPGGSVRVRLVWRAAEAVAGEYRVFVHLVGPAASSEVGTGGGLGAGRRWAQHDGVPVGGGRPTSGWGPGEAIEDRHGLLLPPDMPAGDYWLEVGLAGEGRRLDLESGGNALRLGPVRIAAPGSS